MRASLKFSIGKALLLLMGGVVIWGGSGVWRAVQSGHGLCSSATPDPHPQRIVSLSLATDQILFDLVSQDRIAALSPFSSDPTVSNIVEQVAQIPKIRPDAEFILRLQPDLILGASFNDPRFLENLRRLGCRMILVSRFDSFEGIREDVLLLAREVGEEARGHALIKEMDERLRTVAQLGKKMERPPRVLYLAPLGFTAGRGTTLDEVIRLAGGHNVAGEILEGHGHLSTEVMLKLRPDVLLRTSYAPLDVTTKELFAMQAKRGGEEPREVVVAGKRLISVSPYLVSAVEELGEILRREKQ